MGYSGKALVWYPGLRAAVASDGWEFDEERDELRPVVPGVEVSVQTGWLDRALDARGWSVAAGHYRQALAAFAAGDWASANAQLRSTLEEILARLAEDSAGKAKEKAQAAIAALQAAGVLIEGEDKLLNGLWLTVQARGSHPGLSSEAEARFRLLMTTAQCRFLLEREDA